MADDFSIGDAIGSLFEAGMDRLVPQYSDIVNRGRVGDLAQQVSSGQMTYRDALPKLAAITGDPNVIAKMNELDLKQRGNSILYGRPDDSGITWNTPRLVDDNGNPVNPDYSQPSNLALLNDFTKMPLSEIQRRAMQAQSQGVPLEQINAYRATASLPAMANSLNGNLNEDTIKNLISTGAVNPNYGLSDLLRLREQNIQTGQMTGGDSGTNGILGASAQNSDQQNDISQLHGDDYLKLLPTTRAQQVKALDEGRMQFPSGFALKSPYWQQMISAVIQYDPDFDAVNYNSRASTRKDFTSGKSADSITALNTAMSHLNNLGNAYGQLNNTNYGWENTVENATRNALGDTANQAATANVSTTAEAVSHELAKVFRNTGMSEGEINAWKEKINTSSTPAESKAVIGSAMDLMNGRLQALAARYNQGMGTTKDPLELLSPKAQEAYANVAKYTGRDVPQLQTSPDDASTQQPVPSQNQPSSQNSAIYNGVMAELARRKNSNAR